MVAEGYSANEIAKRVFRAKRTIEHRIEKIKSQLNCCSKSELIRFVQKFEIHEEYLQSSF
ncbi:MAG: hypothetical protein I8H75_04965 [Myxococcaceae bacterium]|nr:hypothetical protein [Myxococcaceae bacterium]MBH2006676.1 hypothetical protein [Myxococcaceae bacterium]